MPPSDGTTRPGGRKGERESGARGHAPRGRECGGRRHLGPGRNAARTHPRGRRRRRRRLVAAVAGGRHDGVARGSRCDLGGSGGASRLRRDRPALAVRLHREGRVRSAPEPRGCPPSATPGTDYPEATAGIVLPPETADYQNWQLSPDTVYYLAPGIHYGNFSANRGDVFVGGYADGVGSTSSTASIHGRPRSTATSPSVSRRTSSSSTSPSRSSPPTSTRPPSTRPGTGGWKLLNSTVTLNVPGGGIFAASDAVLRDNCLTMNGQYGFQSAETIRGDSLTGGPYNVWVERNEISYNDTCGLSGLLQNQALGLARPQPGPAQYRNPDCGTSTGSGNQGGFKLWATNGVMIRDNWIHHNWGVGGWVDTNNANTTWTGNTITDNENGAIWEETSYNFSITDNYLARNNLVDGPDNPALPDAGHLRLGVRKRLEERRRPRLHHEVLSRRQGCPATRTGRSSTDNTLVDNGGGVFLWQNSEPLLQRRVRQRLHADRRAASRDRSAWPAAPRTCRRPPSTAPRIVGEVTGSPPENYWDGCMWETQNVTVIREPGSTSTPRTSSAAPPQAWPACGANGVFSQYGGPNAQAGGADIPTQITFFQNNRWSENVYDGPSTFYAWNQGNQDNPVGWADWTGSVDAGDRCTSARVRQSGSCLGPFGQDVGSTMTGTVSAPTPTR